MLCCSYALEAASVAIDSAPLKVEIEGREHTVIHIITNYSCDCNSSQSDLSSILCIILLLLITIIFIRAVATLPVHLFLHFPVLLLHQPIIWFESASVGACYGLLLESQVVQSSL